MRLSKLTAFIIIVCLSFNSLMAQKETPTMNTQTKLAKKQNKRENDEKITGDWVFGLGLNVVGDSGERKLGDLFKSETANFGNPISLSAEYFLEPRISLKGILSLNKYGADKMINGVEILEGSEPGYIAFDLHVQNYPLRKVLNNNSFEPYITAGLGYTNIGSYKALNQTAEIPSAGILTVNTGLGASYWFSKTWGANANLIGKFGLTKDDNDDTNNHSQLSFGVLYRIEKKSDY